MSWRISQDRSRKRLLDAYDSTQVEQYERWVRELGDRDDRAYLDDLSPDFRFQPGMSVLDVGAGTGALCRALTQISSLSITALEPCEPMGAILAGKPELSDVKLVVGFSDSPDDRQLFAPSSFDVIVSRQVANGLYDPLAAFANWLHWLRPGGTAIVVDGLYDRSAWSGALQDEVDSLPLSACQTTATVPYLMQHSGFEIKAVRLMTATNELPSTRTKRYLVIAEKSSSA